MRNSLFILLLLATLPSWGRSVAVRNYGQLMSNLTRDNTTFVIRGNVDLRGETISLPTDCTIKFKRGAMSNGTIVGADTRIVGVKSRIFRNLSFDGRFLIDYIDYRMFSGYSSDTELVRNMLGLLFSSSEYCSLDLQPNRVYNIDGPKLSYAHALFEYRSIHGKCINGNNAIINDQRPRSHVGYKTYDGVLLFIDCHNISIHHLNYQNLNEDFNEISDNGVVKYRAGIENQIGYVGTSFILLQDDCSDFDISSNIVGARYGIKAGDYSMYWLCGDYGIKRSRFNITASRTGYPVAIEVGDSLNVFVHSEEHHRAAYLCGVSNSSITIEAKDIYIAPYHCILNDAHYSKGDREDVKYKSCYNLKVDITELGSSIATNKDCYCVGMQTYNTSPFYNRSAPLVWENIDITVRKEKAADRVGLATLKRTNPNSDHDPLRVADVYRNISISGSDPFASSQYAFRLRVGEYGQYDNIHIELNAPFGSAICDNANDYYFDLSTSNLNLLYSHGRIISGNGIRNRKTIKSAL